MRSDHPTHTSSGVEIVYPEGHDFEPTYYGDGVIDDVPDYELGWVDPDPGESEPCDDSLGDIVQFVAEPIGVRTVRMPARTVRYRIGGVGPWRERPATERRFRVI